MLTSVLCLLLTLIDALVFEYKEATFHYIYAHSMVREHLLMLLMRVYMKEKQMLFLVGGGGGGESESVYFNMVTCQVH